MGDTGMERIILSSSVCVGGIVEVLIGKNRGRTHTGKNSFF